MLGSARTWYTDREDAIVGDLRKTAKIYVDLLILIARNSDEMHVWVYFCNNIRN